MPERCKGNSKKTQGKPTSFLHVSTPQNRNVNCKCSHPPLSRNRIPILITKIHVADGFWYLSQATLSCYALSRPALEMAFHNRGTGPRLDFGILSSQGGAKFSSFMMVIRLSFATIRISKNPWTMEKLENKWLHMWFFSEKHMPTCIHRHIIYISCKWSMCLFHFNPCYKGLRANWPWSSSANTNTSMVLSDGWIVHIYSGWWLSPTPLKNMSSSVGMMTFPIYGKMKNVPNHQPVLVLSCVILWFSAVWQGRLVWGVIPYENLEVEKGLEWYINMADRDQNDMQWKTPTASMSTLLER